VREYKYYEFQAIDRPLDDRQVGELRRLSSRARITRTTFLNDYQWGDFRGDPQSLMERHFDVFLHFTTRGTHQLMMRLPARLVDLEAVRHYCVGGASSARAHNDSVIVDFVSEEAKDGWEAWYEDGQGRTASILPVRAELVSGDLRALYLSWLLCVQQGQVEDRAVEPRVPAGLRGLSAGLASFADFLRIDVDLIAEAAGASDELAESSATDLSSWARNLSVSDKDVLIDGVLRGDSHLRAELLRRYGSRNPETNEVDAARRTAGELLEAAASRRHKRVRVAAGRLARPGSYERRAADARERYLDALLLREDETWQQVNSLIGTTKSSGYNAAVRLIEDLRVACLRAGREDVFDQRIAELRRRHARKPSFLARLGKAGL
jgi:hypothetical protein